VIRLLKHKPRPANAYFNAHDFDVILSDPKEELVNRTQDAFESLVRTRKGQLVGAVGQALQDSNTRRGSSILEGLE
jgi:hypothetical protein